MNKGVSLCHELQTVAKEVLSDLVETIDSADSEASIAARAAKLLRQRGVHETWYYSCPALVLMGDRSCLSVSGRTYVPDFCQKVGRKNLITVDLSPSRNGVWADCARSFFVEDGVCRSEPTGDDFSEGAAAERRLHQFVLKNAEPNMSFGALCELVAEEVSALNFENLDFGGNFGHSIEQSLEQRVFIERSEKRRLGEVDLFTFEPHIRRVDGEWGFKHENIYHFDSEGRLREL